jgi:dihydroneopterin aldolase
MVVVLAQEEAVYFGHNLIGTEHILLGLVRESEGVAARVLSNLGVDPDKVRREVVRMLRAARAAVAHDVAHSGGTEDMQFVKVRAKVKALEVYVHCGVSAEERALPQTLLLNLEYVYKVQSDDHIYGVVDYSILLEGVAQALEREEFQLLETGARRVGEHVLECFPEVWKLTFRVTKVRVPVARAASGVTVEATSGR